MRRPVRIVAILNLKNFIIMVVDAKVLLIALCKACLGVYLSYLIFGVVLFPFQASPRVQYSGIYNRDSATEQRF